MAVSPGAGPGSYRVVVSSGLMIDWELAISTGVRWVRPGPQVSLAEARAVVSELHELAAAVAEPVREVTGMSSTEDIGRVAVVDRPGWIRANVDGFRVVLDPLVDHLREQGRVPPPGSVVTALGSRVTGVQAGLILAYLAGRVLGQYELFLPPDPEVPEDAAPAGRLTLVAPNILMVERELDVDPHDFRRWVCLHEETHRTQFTSVSWLRGYVQQQMTDFLLASDLDPATILGRLRSAADAVAGAVRGNGHGDSLIEAIQTPRQREVLERLTCVMTLVEGHGDYVMDAVGPQVVPTVAQIRERFNARRSGAGGTDDPPDPGHRPEDEAVRPGLALRPDGRARGRDGGLQPGLDLTGNTPDRRRTDRPAPVARAGRGRRRRGPGPGRRQRLRPDGPPSRRRGGSFRRPPVPGGVRRGGSGAGRLLGRGRFAGAGRRASARGPAVRAARGRRHRGPRAPGRLGGPGGRGDPGPYRPWPGTGGVPAGRGAGRAGEWRPGSGGADRPVRGAGRSRAPHRRGSGPARAQPRRPG